MAMATEFLPSLAYDDTPGLRRPSCPPCMTSRRSPTARRQSPQPLVQRSLLSPASSPSNSPAVPARHSQLQGSGQNAVELPSEASRQKSRSLSSLLYLSTTATGGQQQARRATSPSNNAIAASTAAAAASQYVQEAEIEEEAASPSYRRSSTLRNGSAACLLPSTRATVSASSDAGVSSQSADGAGHLVASGHVGGGNGISAKWCPFFEFNDVLTTCLHRQTTSKAAVNGTSSGQSGAHQQQNGCSKKEQHQHAVNGSINGGVCGKDESVRNYSSCLELTKLENGRFTGRLSIVDFPPGDLEVRLRDSTVVFFVASATSGASTPANGRKVAGSASVGLAGGRLLVSPVLDGAGRSSKPRKSSGGELTKVGQLDLPIYVNPDTVRVDVDGTGSSVTVTGMTKGYLDRDRGARSSLSLSQLLAVGLDSASSSLGGMAGSSPPNGHYHVTPPPRRNRIINSRIFSRLQFNKRSSSATAPSSSSSRDPTPEDPLRIVGRLRSHTT